MERDYMHLGDITKRDIANEIRDIKTSHQYPEEGWKINGDPTTLQYLAELWAEQENEEQPEDRGTFPFWLEKHVDDGRVEEPENRIYEVTVLVATRQYVQFSAPEGMDSEEAKAWFDEHRDDEGAIVFEGSEEIADEELYMDGE